MLKISVVDLKDGSGRIETSVESSGPLSDVVAELGLALSRMYFGLRTSNPEAAAQFRGAVQLMIADPDFWEYEPKGEVVEMHAQIATIPRRKQ